MGKSENLRRHRGGSARVGSESREKRRGGRSERGRSTCRRESAKKTSRSVLASRRVHLSIRTVRDRVDGSVVAWRRQQTQEESGKRRERNKGNEKRRTLVALPLGGSIEIVDSHPRIVRRTSDEPVPQEGMKRDGGGRVRESDGEGRVMSAEGRG